MLLLYFPILVYCTTMCMVIIVWVIMQVCCMLHFDFTYLQTPHLLWMVWLACATGIHARTGHVGASGGSTWIS